jgi:ribose transport system permease protein/L-arabinose transport system permease protein
VNPVVATLATLSAFRGVAFLIAPEGKPVGVLDPTFALLGSGRVLQVGGFPGHAHRLRRAAGGGAGRATSSVLDGVRPLGLLDGRQPGGGAARGIDLNRMRLAIYTISGRCGPRGGIITARTSSGQPLSGTGLELEAITAVFLGGALLAGGKGTVAGTMLAVLLLAVLSNGMNLLGIPDLLPARRQGASPGARRGHRQWRMAIAERRQAQATAAGVIALESDRMLVEVDPPLAHG